MNTWKVSREPYGSRPISPLLCGNFVEFGYGCQVEPMTAELLFNRSFEKFPPYRLINKLWYDLYEDEKDLSRGYETDWSKFDWYHSGYEHNGWFAAPNVTPQFQISDESTFFEETTPYRDVRIHRVPGGVHGESCLRVENRETELRGGAAQSGLRLRRGAAYDFSGYVRRLSGSGRVVFEILKKGDWDSPAVRRPFDITDDYQKFQFGFVCEESGVYTLCMWAEPQSGAEADCFSLVDRDNIAGFRRDVVETVREKIAPRVIRWPGGCFASFYDFADAIGEKDKRRPVPSYFWGGQWSNDVGSLEMASFCEAVGAEQMVCVNLYHPRKDYYDVYINGQGGKHGFYFPQFTDVNEGAKHAAEWVEYLNGSADTKMGARRARDGHPEPFRVRFFEMDNEVHRWFDPESYAKACVLYAKAMKAVDPTIKIGMVSYADTIIAKLPEMLEIAGKSIDFLADRGADENNLRAKLQVLHTYNAAHGTDIRYCNTEWLPFDLSHTDMDAYNYVKGNKCYQFTKWCYAHNIFRQIMMWQRAGDEVLFVNFNNLANTHGQNVIDTPKDGIYVSAAGKAMGLLSKSPAYRVLKIDGYKAKLSDGFQAQAALGKTGDKVVLYVSSMEAESREAAFDLTAFGDSLKKAEITVMSADSMAAMSHEKRDEISTDTFTAALSGTLKLHVPPFSFIQAVCSKA